MLQCVAVCCSVLQCVAVLFTQVLLLLCFGVSQQVAPCCSMCCSVLQCVVVCCSVLNDTTRPHLESNRSTYSTRCSTLQHTAALYITLQETHCNALTAHAHTHTHTHAYIHAHVHTNITHTNTHINLAVDDIDTHTHT